MTHILTEITPILPINLNYLINVLVSLVVGREDSRSLILLLSSETRDIILIKFEREINKLLDFLGTNSCIKRFQLKKKNHLNYHWREGENEGGHILSTVIYCLLSYVFLCGAFLVIYSLNMIKIVLLYSRRKMILNI